MNGLRARRELGAVALLPVGLAVAGWLVTRSFLDELPDPVATHWGASSAPDGFTARDSVALVDFLLTIGVGLVLGAILWVACRRAPMLRRLAGALPSGLAGFVAALSVASLWMQRGLADAREATQIGPALGFALVVGIGTGIVGALLMPGEAAGVATAKAAPPTDAPRVALAPGERAAWTGWATSPVLLYVGMGAVLLPLVVLAALGVVALPVLATVLPAAVLMLAMATFRVTVGQGGLLVRSIAGWPRFSIPLAEVAEASVGDVRPLRDFGGWGVRVGRGRRSGVVLRAGEALEVLRGDGSRFVVTIDRPQEAAALLNTLADRGAHSR